MRLLVSRREPAADGLVGDRLERARLVRRLDARSPARRRVGGGLRLGVAQHQRSQAAGVAQAERLADHAADGQPDEVGAVDFQGVQHQDDIIGELIDRIGGGESGAAAVAAEIDAERPVARVRERGDLLGPHAEIGGEGVGESHDRARLGADHVVADVPSFQWQQHDCPGFRVG
jgi:hypothetical protein